MSTTDTTALGVSLGRLESEFRAKRDDGRKLLVPYITGGYPGWQDAIRAAAANGADAIEIGIPFSDPVMDGPVIQQASQAALDAGADPGADPRRGARPRRRHPARRDDVLQPRAPSRARRGSPPTSDVPASARRSCPTFRSRSPVRGARRPTRTASRRSCSPHRRLPTSACRSWSRPVARLHLLGRPARGDGGAVVARRDRDRRWPDGSRRSPTRRCSSVSACPMRRRPTRRPASPTASSRGRASSGG